MDTERTRRIFRSFASPAIFGFAFLTGVLYAWLIYWNHAEIALLGLGVSLFTSGVMGLVYFFHETWSLEEVPYLIEALKVLGMAFILAGAAYTTRSFSDVYVPAFDALTAVSYFFTGAMVGAIFAINLIFLVSLRVRIASWRVVPFPRWIAVIFQWATARKRG